jgi:hypothetical protein
MISPFKVRAIATAAVLVALLVALFFVDSESWRYALKERFWLLVSGAVVVLIAVAWYRSKKQRAEWLKNTHVPVNLHRYIMPGKQVVTLELQKLDLLLKDLRNRHGNTDGPAHGTIQGCEQLLQCGRVACDAQLSLLSWIRFSNDDYVWGVIRAVKRQLMQIVGVDELKVLIASCYEDLPYSADTDKKTWGDQLKRISKKLDLHRHDDTRALAVLRSNLRAIALRIHQAPQEFWWKVNDHKIRMLIFTVALCVLLGSLVVCLSRYRSDQGPFYTIIVLLGALGGLLGGLLRTEDVKCHLGTFFIKRVEALLSPVVGACGALAVYLLLKSGIITLPKDIATANPSTSSYFYAIAFFSGFSERLLLKFLEKGSDFEPGRQKHKAKG